MKSRVITFRINPTDNRLLEKHAEEKNKSKSDLLRELVSNFLKEKGLA